MLSQEEYQARRNARIERLLLAADRANRESESLLGDARKMAEVIPFGQPILIGHHSEKSDRNYRARIESKWRNGYALYKKANELKSRAESAASNDAIYSDDPSAVQKLKEKLAGLQEQQALYKKINAAHTKFVKNPASLDLSDLSDELKNTIRNYKPEYSWEPHPIAPFQLSNLSANIRNVEKQIEKISKKQSLEDRVEMIGEIKIEYSPSENRIRIFYPARVDLDTYKALKSHGYRVLRSAGEGAFSGYYNNNCLWFIKQYIKKEA